MTTYTKPRKIYSQVASDSAKERLESIRQSLKMIEIELQKYDAQNGWFTAQDAKDLKDLDNELIEAFVAISEAGF
jgi:uncharacterized protein involved in exopolysaccharide biosynthesis